MRQSAHIPFPEVEIILEDAFVASATEFRYQISISPQRFPYLLTSLNSWRSKEAKGQRKL